jgi:hypothetical protein
MPHGIIAAQCNANFLRTDAPRWCLYPPPVVRLQNGNDYSSTARVPLARAMNSVDVTPLDG